MIPTHPDGSTAASWTETAQPPARDSRDALQEALFCISTADRRLRAADSAAAGDALALLEAAARHLDQALDTGG